MGDGEEGERVGEGVDAVGMLVWECGGSMVRVGGVVQGL